MKIIENKVTFIQSILVGSLVIAYKFIRDSDIDNWFIDE